MAVARQDEGVLPGQQERPITFLLVRNTGTVAGPYTVQTKKYGNEYRASWGKTLNLVTSINTKYRAVVTHSGKKGSRWVPLKASC
jgi:hypothetical protein